MSAMNGRQGRIASKGTELVPAEARQDETRQPPAAAAAASQKRLRRRTGSGEHVTVGKHGRGTGQAARQASLAKQPMSGAQIGLRIPIWH